MLPCHWLPERYRGLAAEFEPEGDSGLLLDVGRELERDGHLEGAATILDRAYGLDPLSLPLREARQRVLDALEVVEHGLRFRYVPGGVFLMGRLDGEPDERPWHPAWLSPYWMSETPVSWSAFCRLMDWELPPNGGPRGDDWSRLERMEQFYTENANKIRLQYCEDRTLRAIGWHYHHPLYRGRGGAEPDHRPPRSDPNGPWTYDDKPMVAVSWEQATALGERLTTSSAVYSLPTEAQWEKAARGGVIGARYAWVDAPPSPEHCDCGRFGKFSILPSKTFAPNGYGLYAMSGGVWEWTRDWYDAQFYTQSPDADPEGPPEGKEKVLRGGSWADCADVVTVSYRTSRRTGLGGDERGAGAHMSPTIGFRLCRRRSLPVG
jgi:formylglycine-generating enzyme required for sulfatase activity